MTEIKDEFTGTNPPGSEEISVKTENETSKLKSSLPVLVLVLTFFTYAGTLGFEFVYDDVTQIVKNYRIQEWSYFPDYFVSHIWVHRDPGQNGNYYRPVFLIWLLINYKLFGLNPWSWHLTTVLTHLVATLGVFLLAERLTKDRLMAGYAALIFGLHPSHIEAVAWISGVTEPLMAIPLIFAFLAYLNNREGRPKARWWLAASLVLYSLALLEKETSLILIGLIFLYEWLLKKEENKTYFQRILSAGTRTVPYLTVTALYIVARTIALNGFNHVEEVNKLPVATSFLTLPIVIWSYVKLLIFPVGLSGSYDTPVVNSPGLWTFYLPVIALVIITIGLWKAATRRPLVQFAIVLMLIPLLPVLHFPTFGEGNFVHDRYLYIPSIGFSVLIAMALQKLKPGKEKFLGQPATYAAAALVLAVLLVPATTLQSYVWADDARLHYHMVETAPKNTTIRFNLADILFEQYRYREAGEQYEKLLEIMPQQWTSNFRLGYIYMMSGELDKAELHLRRAIDASPGKNSKPHMLLGFVLKDTDRLDEATQSLRLALKLDPNTMNAHYGLGLVLLKQGNPAQALEEFNIEYASNPDYPKLQEYIAEAKALINKTASEKEQPPQSIN